MRCAGEAGGQRPVLITGHAVAVGQGGGGNHRTVRRGKHQLAKGFGRVKVMPVDADINIGAITACCLHPVNKTFPLPAMITGNDHVIQQLPP